MTGQPVVEKRPPRPKIDPEDDDRPLPADRASSGNALKGSPAQSPVLFSNLAAVRCAAMAPDRRSFATGHADGLVRTWDLVKCVQMGCEFTCETGNPTSLAFHPSGGLMAVLMPRAIGLYEFPGGRLKFRIEIAGNPSAVAFSSAGDYLALAEQDGRLTIRRTEDLRVVRRVGGFGEILSIAWCEDRRQFAVASGDNIVRLWSPNGDEKPKLLLGHSDWVVSMDADTSLGGIVTGSWDRTLRLWDTESGQAERTFKGHSTRVTAVAVSPNGQLLASGADDGSVKLWELATGREIQTFRAHASRVTAAVFANDDRLFSCSEDGSARLWATTSDEHEPTNPPGSGVEAAGVPPQASANSYAETVEQANDLVALKRFEEAAGRYRKAIEMRPRYADPHYCLGECLLALDQSDEAILSFQKAVELQPQSGKIWWRLGSALSQAGRNDEAVKALKQSAELLPEFGLVQISLGNALLSQSAFADAKVAFQEAVRLLPKSHEAHHGLALTLARENNLDDAIKEVKKAIDLKRDYSQAYSDLIEMMLAKGAGNSSQAAGWAELAKKQGLTLRAETLDRLRQAVSRDR